MSGALDSFGTLLQMGDGGAPENFTTIAEVLDIAGPELSVDTEEVTNHSSPGGYEELIATIKRSGNVTFDINFIPTNATHNQTTGLLAKLKNKTKTNFRLQLTDAAPTKWTFAAFVVGFSGSSPVAGVQRGSITLKITGEPVLA